MPVPLAPETAQENISPSTAVALAPQRLPPPDRSGPRKRPMRQALAMSGGLAALVIFALSGTWRGTTQDGAMDASRGMETVAALPLAGHAGDPVTESVKPAAASTKKPATAAHPERKKSVERRPEVRQPNSTGARQAQTAQSPAKSVVKPVQPAQPHEGTTLAAQAPRTENRYAQCEALDSFLRREQCKWKVCNGKWGQDGCPSYAPSGGDA